MFLELTFIIWVCVLLLQGFPFTSSFKTAGLKSFYSLTPASIRHSRSSYLLAGPKKLSGSGCKVCKGSGGMNCMICKGKGIDKVGGSVLERWTCKKCKGFGYVPCTSCNLKSNGLTPEQTGER